MDSMLDRSHYYIPHPPSGTIVQKRDSVILSEYAEGFNWLYSTPNLWVGPLWILVCADLLLTCPCSAPCSADMHAKVSTRRNLYSENGTDVRCVIMFKVMSSRMPWQSSIPVIAREATGPQSPRQNPRRSFTNRSVPPKPVGIPESRPVRPYS